MGFFSFLIKECSVKHLDKCSELLSSRYKEKFDRYDKSYQKELIQVHDYIKKEEKSNDTVNIQLLYNQMYPKYNILRYFDALMIKNMLESKKGGKRKKSKKKSKRKKSATKRKRKKSKKKSSKRKKSNRGRSHKKRRKR